MPLTYSWGLPRGNAAFPAASPPVSSGDPYIAFLDLLGGPASGGENGDGVPLRIYGRNFGSVLADIAVTINGTAVAQKYSLGTHRDPDMGHIQCIAVQVAAGTTTGAVKVTVGGVDSNTDNTFAVQSGSIVFVSPSGSSGNPGTFASPKNPGFLADYFPSAGTTTILRGGDYTTGLGSNGILIHNSTGDSSGWINLTSQPGEADARIIADSTNASNMCVRVFSASGVTSYIAIANLVGNLSGGSQRSCVFGLHDNSDNCRLVGCEATGMYENSGGSAAIAGSGSHIRLLGNYIHDNDGSKLYHSIYWDGRASSASTDIEVAYNGIHNQKGGRGIQLYSDTGRLLTNCNVHHNWVESIHLDGILFSRDMGTGQKCWSNVVTGCGDSSLVHPTADDGSGGAGIRLTDSGASTQIEIEVFHNTCVLNNIDTLSGEIALETFTSCVMRNNLFYSTRAYTAGSDTTTLTSSNNLWNGNGSPPGFDTNPRNGSPNFVNLGALNFDLAAGSDAIGNGHNLSGASFTPDRDFLLRPFNATRDIGAFAYQA